jgi:hypothetical protein
MILILCLTYCDVIVTVSCRASPVVNHELLRDAGVGAENGRIKPLRILFL